MGRLYRLRLLNRRVRLEHRAMPRPLSPPPLPPRFRPFSPRSLVVYVTGDVGGPTLVTTQRLTSKRLAEHGWIVHPRENRVCVFDGGVLHGVIPGRGIAPAPADEPRAPPRAPRVVHTADIGSGVHKRVPSSSHCLVLGERKTGDHRRRRRRERGGAVGDEAVASAPSSGAPCRSDTVGALGRSSEVGTEASPMRVTWMVAFWKDIQARPRITGGETESSSPSGAGAAQPFPMEHCHDPRREASTKAESNSPTWPSLFWKKPGWPGDGDDWAGGTPVLPTAIPAVWEDVDGAGNRRIGASVRRLKHLPPYEMCFQGF